MESAHSLEPWVGEDWCLFTHPCCYTGHAPRCGAWLKVNSDFFLDSISTPFSCSWLLTFEHLSQWLYLSSGDGSNFHKHCFNHIGTIYGLFTVEVVDILACFMSRSSTVLSLGALLFLLLLSISEIDSLALAVSLCYAWVFRVIWLYPIQSQHSLDPQVVVVLEYLFSSLLKKKSFVRSEWSIPFAEPFQGCLPLSFVGRKPLWGITLCRPCVDGGVVCCLVVVLCLKDGRTTMVPVLISKINVFFVVDWLSTMAVARRILRRIRTSPTTRQLLWGNVDKTLIF